MKKRAIHRVLIVTIVVLFLPIFSYTALQFMQSDKNQKLVQSIYDRQLDSILFSINQHCWDIFSTWLSEISSHSVTAYNNRSPQNINSALGEFVEMESVVSGAFLRVTPDLYYSYMDNRSVSKTSIKDNQFRVNADKIITDKQKVLERMIRLAKEGYVRPIAVQLDTMQSSDVPQSLLLFPIVDESFPINSAAFSGIIINNEKYVREIVARRFSSLNEGEFIFAVSDSRQDQFLYLSSEEKPDANFEKSQTLWILPHLDIKIKLSGTTLGEISKKQIQTNLLLLVAVNVLFIAGMAYLLRNTYKEMELARMKTNFVANVSHELRTPISLIRMYAETLEMGRIEGENKLKKYYRTILAETDRLSKLINNILDFSKIESNKKTYQMVRTDMKDLVEKALHIYHYHLQKNNFELDVHMTEHPVMLKVDPEAVTQAFVNLIDNAIKYSDSSQKIDINLNSHDNDVVLSVSDQGIGIPESEQDKIFDKFYRVGSSTVHNTKGSGLGLSLVKHIMQVHQGEVKLKSKPGEGSTFSLVFPTNQNQ
ncbi:MAG: HAMP domain-containing sensor histidine kinase [candidate division KSB1 bacterium]|nr:HAMP domain-containing sensor histidine kinase [candidate division KSB1 bacterium]